MNKLETRVAWELDNLPNIKWWHRNIARTGFNINGYVNAYPDIIAMTENGILSRGQAIDSLKVKKLYDQYVFASEYSISLSH